jgi:CP family cyanate transporter-like MFS transporter
VSMGPLIGLIRGEFGLSHASAALLIAIPDVLMGLLAVPAPALARRLGRDRVVLAALIVLLLATVARALSDSAATLFVSTAAVGAGIAVAGALIGGVVKATFPERAAPLLGVYAAALAFGATLAGGLSGPAAVLGDGWRFSAGVWAIPGLFAIMAWLFVIARVPYVPKIHRERYDLPVRERRAWLIGLFFGANNFLFYALVSWIALLFRERGMTETAAGLVLASFTCSQLVSSLLGGVLSRTRDRRFPLAAFSGVALLGLMLLAIDPGADPFLVVPVISLGLGGGFTLGMTLPLDNTRDADEANVWGAFTILIAYLIAATGPLLVGALRDATGDFAASLWLLASVGVAMLALTPFLRPNRTEGPV